MADLTDVRRLVGQALHEYAGGTIDSAASTTIADADLIDPVETDSLYANGWLWIATGNAANTERRILRYAPATGTITVSRAFGVTPAAADEYEIHTLIRPSELNRLINEGVEPLYYVGGYEQAISNTEQTLYGGYFTDSPGNILSVVNRGAYSAGEEAEVVEYPVIWKTYINEAGSIIIEIEPGSITDSSGYIVVRYLKRNGSLTTTNNLHVDEDYAVCAALIKCYEYLMRQGPAQDASRWERMLVYEQTRMAGLHRRYGPRGRVVRIVIPQTIGRLGS